PQVRQYHVADLLVVGKRAGRQFAGFLQGQLGVEEVVDDILDRSGRGIGPGFAASVQGVPLLQVAVQGAIGVIPGAEEVRFAPDLLCPALRGVSVQREFGVRLSGLARLVRKWGCGKIRVGHGDFSLTWSSLWPRPGRYKRPGHL